MTHDTISFEAFEERHRVPVIDIFNHYIRTGTAAFRREEVGFDHFDKYLANARELCGYAILDERCTVIGFCQLKPWADHDTFAHTAEVAYFLKPEAIGRGIGSIILERLIADAARMKKRQLLATISGENEASLRFHRKHGFTECGRFRKVGNKFGRDFDVVFMQRTIERTIGV